MFGIDDVATAASAINSVAGLFGSGNQNAAVGEQMQWQLAHQRTLRQTGWQDTVKDMQAAGINPMAAYGSGATSAAGGGGTAAPQSKRLQNAQAAAAATSAMAATAQIDNIREQTALTEAQKRKVEAEIPAVTTSAENVAQQTKNLQATLPKIQAEIDSLREGKNLTYQQSLTEPDKRNLMEAQRKLAQIDHELRAGQIDNVKAMTETQQVLTHLRRQEVPGAENLAAYERLFGSDAGNVPKAIGGIANTVRKVIGK